MINYDDRDWAGLRIELESELFFQSLEKSWPRFIRLEVHAGRQGAVNLGCKFHDEVIFSSQSRFIYYCPICTNQLRIRKVRGNHFHGHISPANVDATGYRPS